MQQNAKLVILIQRVMDVSVREVVAGVSQVALEQGWVLQCVSPDTAALDALPYGLRPAGAVALVDAPGLLSELRAMKVPVVMAGHCGGWATHRVDLDEEAIGAAAADHLLERGITSFAGWGLGDHEFSRRRLEAFADRVRQQPDCHYHGVCGAWHAGQSDRNGVASWLRRLPKPAGILAGCDNWGGILINFCRFARVRVPEDIAVVGVDDDPVICELCHPPLSSVPIPWHRMGMVAGRTLAEQMNSPRSAQNAAPPPVGPLPVVVRHSSNTIAVDDPEVAAALAIIYEHAGRPLTVSTVLRRVCTYERRLERAFKRHLGRSIRDEILRVHVDQAKRILQLTDLPMPEVARLSGFSDYKRLGEAFRRVVGIQPRAYRTAICRPSR